MDERKAIDKLRYRGFMCSWELTEDIEMAIEALEKQIPQKPIQPQGFPRFGYCPNCGKTVTKHSSYVGCTWCLQRLDWSE